MCLLDLYQDPKAGDGRIPRKAKRPHISSDLLPGEPRLYSPSKESDHDSNTRDRVLGYDDTHPLLGAPPLRSDNQETEGESDLLLLTCSGRLECAREDKCCVTSCSTNTSLLQTYPERSSKGTREGQPMLQWSLPTFRWCEDRPRLVGTPSSQVELEAQWSDKRTCLVVSRQHDCSSIHQQPGRDSITRSNHLSKRFLDVVPGEGHYSISTTPTRKAECDRRSGVKVMRDQSDWMVMFQKILVTMSPMEVDIFGSRLTNQLFVLVVCTITIVINIVKLSSMYIIERTGINLF